MKWVVLLVLVVIALTAFALWRRMQALPQSAANHPATRPLTPGATGSAEPDGDVSGPDPSGPDSRTPR